MPANGIKLCEGHDRRENLILLHTAVRATVFILYIGLITHTSANRSVRASKVGRSGGL